MGQVNLYKIDENKRIGFLDQLREKLIRNQSKLA